MPLKQEVNYAEMFSTLKLNEWELGLDYFMRQIADELAYE